MQIQVSNSNTNKLLNIFAAYLYKYGSQPLFSNCAELHSVINGLQVGEAAWESFGVRYCGKWTENPAPWMDDVYNIWMCDPKTTITQILGNREFHNLVNLILYREYNSAADSCCWQNFMSGNWAWEEVVNGSQL